MTVGAVILAAGAARRFGADKRLQPLGASTVGQITLDKYASAFAAVRVVVRSENDPLIRDMAPIPHLTTLVARNAHLGMGHSLAAGFTDLDWSFAFVALADMPLIKPSTLKTLIEQARLSSHNIIRPVLPHGNPGHPIGFPAELFPELRQCSGDQGARPLLEKYRPRIANCKIDDAGITNDIDTPQALANAQALFSD